MHTPTHFFFGLKTGWDRGIIMAMTDRWADKQKKQHNKS